jgi:hypothetical protein
MNLLNNLIMELKTKTPEELHELAVATANGEVFCGLHFKLLGIEPLTAAQLLPRVFMPLAWMEWPEKMQLLQTAAVPYQYMKASVGTINRDLPSFLEVQWLTYEDAEAVITQAGNIYMNQ